MLGNKSKTVYTLDGYVFIAVKNSENIIRNIRVARIVDRILAISDTNWSVQTANNLSTLVSQAKELSYKPLLHYPMMTSLDDSQYLQELLDIAEERSTSICNRINSEHQRELAKQHIEILNNTIFERTMLDNNDEKS